MPMKRVCLVAALWTAGAGLAMPCYAQPATSPAATTEQSAARTPAPSGDALKEAVRLVTAVFKEDLAAAKNVALKGELARKMLAAGKEEKDPTGRYAILVMAKDLGVESGEIEAVRGAIEELDRWYTVDAAKLATDGALAASRNMRTAEQRKALAEWCPDLLEDAIENDRYDVARTIMEAYQTAVRGSGDAAMQKEATEAAQRVRELTGAFNAVKRAMDTLQARMSDPDANLKVGRFNCFYKGDWKTGLRQLSASGDKTLAPLAQLELSGASEPDVQVKLADGWWDAGQSGSSLAKMQTQRHALELYKSALPKLTGLVKVRVEKRVQEAEASPGVLQKGGGALAKGAEDIATKILSKIPAAMLPTKDDAPLDLRTKASAVSQWLRNNRLVDRNGTSVTVTMPFEGCSMSTAGTSGQRLSIRFREQSTFKGMECSTTLYVSRAVSGMEDPEYKTAKQMESDGKSATYQVTAMVNYVSIYFSKPSADDPPHVMITMDATRPGAYSVKPVTKKP